MPYEKCFEFRGKLYCWNTMTKKINIIENVDIDKCPEEVITGIMTVLGETVEKLKNGN
jgi:hypothetical protein